MAEVKCYIPKTLEEALAIRKATGAIPLAGGTDLMVQHYEGSGLSPVFKKPIMIITNLCELKGIKKMEDGSVEIGALTVSREIAECEDVHYLVRSAASRMGAISLRNSATIGGNIGNASPKGDLPQPLILLDAEVELISLEGSRRMLLDDFIKGAKKTELREDEIISKVIIPPADFTYIFYRKIGTRRANAISKLSLSAACKVKDGKIVDFRASSGAAGPKVARGKDAERMLIGLAPEELKSRKEEFLDAWNGVISPHAMPEWRRNSTRRMLDYFIDAVASGSPEGIIE
ncbi:MAG: FAD binding domain-containing protein [Spirochaetales bacterium]|nr:FAD binding domain-containing protein [Spirochaetales bacterium]